MESKARMVLNLTPRFAKLAAPKTANMPSAAVQTDLFDDHDVYVSRDYITKLSDKVGELAKNSESFIKYDGAKDQNKDEISAISVSLDGTALLLKDKDKKPTFREAMAGVVSLADKDCGRRSAVYAGEVPEYGKETFLERLELELSGAESLLPNAAVQGIAGGAAHNWVRLTPGTDVQVLDSHHMPAYVCKASDILFPKKPSDRDGRTETWLRKIKHSNNNGVDLLIDELEERRQALKKPSAEELDKVLVHLNNQKGRTHYRRERANNRPVGSGAAEAVCKTLIKQRVCCSEVRRSKDGASNIIRNSFSYTFKQIVGINFGIII
ncbi:MAG: hypothetical protein LBP22_13680 [Deltaproteobacteria bacterium]|nr:hypothetical protein [Deltaproteobacteria bacterium]